MFTLRETFIIEPFDCRRFWRVWTVSYSVRVWLQGGLTQGCHISLWYRGGVALGSQPGTHVLTLLVACSFHGGTWVLIPRNPLKCLYYSAFRVYTLSVPSLLSDKNLQIWAPHEKSNFNISNTNFIKRTQAEVHWKNEQQWQLNDGPSLFSTHWKSKSIHLFKKTNCILLQNTDACGKKKRLWLVFFSWCRKGKKKKKEKPRKLFFLAFLQ